MHLPRRITPRELRTELANAGRSVTLRTLRLWRTQGLLPPVIPEARKGYRRGRGQVWRSPSLLAQAATADRLRALNYPNDEARLFLWCAGFSVQPSNVRSAWLSRLGKIGLHLKKKRAAAVDKNNGPLLNKEDEAVALVSGGAGKLAKHFGLDRNLAIDSSVALFGIVFDEESPPDADLLYNLTDMLGSALQTSFGQDAPMVANEFARLLTFMRRTVTFDAVAALVSSASDADLCHTHRRWRWLVRIFKAIFPEIATDEKGQLIAMRAARTYFPIVVHLAHERKLDRLDQTLAQIDRFVAERDIRAMFGAALSKDGMSEGQKKDLATLVCRLSEIWQYRRFPFSAA